MSLWPVQITPENIKPKRKTEEKHWKTKETNKNKKRGNRMRHTHHRSRRGRHRLSRWEIEPSERRGLRTMASSELHWLPWLMMVPSSWFLDFQNWVFFIGARRALIWLIKQKENRETGSVFLVSHFLGNDLGNFGFIFIVVYSWWN